MHESLIKLLSIILPEGIENYFELINYTKSEEELHLYLEESNKQPEEFIKEKLTSKGFFSEVTIQDFPIRGMQVYLHIKRRRWLNESNGKVVFRDWNLVAKGTRITKDFASFLKEISRYPSL
jgi:hypothetical protein